MNQPPFQSLPEVPIAITAPLAIARVVDALGFRYRWATEDLTENEIQFRPVESSMSMMELIKHIYDLSAGANKVFGGQIEHDKSLKGFSELRNATFEHLLDLSQRLNSISEEEFIGIEKTRLANGDRSFWFWINGPIVDALTHVGQITSWRRIAGNPQPAGVNQFLGVKR